MAKTVIDSRGVVTSKDGNGIELRSPTTVKGGIVRSVTSITSDTTLTQDGVFTVGGAGAITVTLPDPSDVAGGHFVIRSLSAHAHLLTSSQVTQDTQTITDGTDVGARLALEAVVGSSVLLVSDGLNYLVPVASGTFTLSTPSS